MDQKLNEGIIMKALDYAYDKAINGLPGLDTAYELAQDYVNNDDDIISNANSLIRWQIAKTSTSGFITGLGGLLTMPITIPANITSVLYVQIRMIAAIAHMGGHDLKCDKVKTFVYVCLAGNGAAEILKGAGIAFGQKLAINLIKNMSYSVIKEINKKVGFRLLTKFGEKGIVNMGKTIPIIGGVIGGTIDGVSTNVIGDIAIKTFISQN